MRAKSPHSRRQREVNYVEIKSHSGVITDGICWFLDYLSLLEFYNRHYDDCFLRRIRNDGLKAALSECQGVLYGSGTWDVGFMFLRLSCVCYTQARLCSDCCEGNDGTALSTSFGDGFMTSCKRRMDARKSYNMNNRSIFCNWCNT